MTPNDLDAVLRESRDLDARRAAWRASKEVGPTLTDGLETLVGLRNETVQALGYDDYFAYQTSDYDLSPDEMVALMRQLNAELRPLYRELHTWARYTLAERYGEPVPRCCRRTGCPTAGARTGRRSCRSTAWTWTAPSSSAAPSGSWSRPSASTCPSDSSRCRGASTRGRRSTRCPPDTPFKKNTHASAWHLDLQRDVRSLMSSSPTPTGTRPRTTSWGTSTTTSPTRAPRCRPSCAGGANRAYHEAVGSLMGLASLQPRFLQPRVGLFSDDIQPPDPIQTLLREALNYAVFIPFSAGTMTLFEHDLYTEDLAPEQWNARWWELAREFQGIVPPDSARAAVGAQAAPGVLYNDAATKTHINDDAAQYYDYALSNVLLFQLHDHIATEILNEDPRDTNYFGQQAVGDFLKTILEPGATVDGNALLEQTTARRSRPSRCWTTSRR